MSQLDVSFARSFFPALESEWAFFDNAGGSVTPRPVIDRVTDYLSRHGVQLGATYASSAEAAAKVAAGKAAAAALLGAAPEEIIVGSSTTMNTFVVSRALAPLLRQGDEIVVTNLDHESNVGSWRRLAEAGAVLREWKLRPETLALELEDLRGLLNERTRLVCFTQTSNIAGRIHDAAAACRMIRDAGAWSLVDGVAYAPHRRVDLAAIGADFYLVSLYKIFGPHQAVLWGRPERLLELRGVNHFFFDEDQVPYKLQPGSVNHELTASLPGILDYLHAIDAHHHGAGADTPTAIARAFALFEAHEHTIAAPLVDFLRAHPRVHLLGPATNDPAERVVTFSFVVEGRDASEIPPLLDRQKLAIRYGHFYSYRAIEALGLLEKNGVVRISLAHYNTAEEVARLLAVLDRVL